MTSPHTATSQLAATRNQVLRYRWRAQQLDFEGAPSATHTTVLDLGVQDGGGQAAGWALANRGVDVDAAVAATQPDSDLALTWTIRGAPHFYRRAELPAVQTAVSPFSDADAGKRVFDAAKPLRAAGVPILAALTDVARHERDIVAAPTVKGDLSGQLTRRMGPEYLRYCRPCQTTHLYEQPFRLAALHAGLELLPGTSPPVLRRIAGWAPSPLGPAPDPTSAPPRLQVIRAYLHLLGPATPKDVATYLDAPVAVVKEHWPTDATEVRVNGTSSWLLAEDLPAFQAAAEPPDQTAVRLLSPVDLFTAAKDRQLLVPDADQRKALWPVLGRPGAIALDGAIVGTWRARTAGRSLTLRLSPWTPLQPQVDQHITDQAERLARLRGLGLAGIVTE